MTSSLTKNFSETWHQQNDFLNLNLCIDKPRATGKGGGLAVVYSSEVSVTEITVPPVLSFESIAFKVSGVSPVLILFIYRPSKPNPLFFEELTELLAFVNPIHDINIHVDNPSCTHTTNLMEILDWFNLIQHVNFSTHRKGHTLDLVCTAGADINRLEGFVYQ